LNLYFLLPFLLVALFGVYQEGFAQETIIGYDHFHVKNPDGTGTYTTHHPYILENGVYVPFVNSGLETRTQLGIVTLNNDGTYSWNGKFTDKIIGKYADISDLNSWTYLTSLNNDTPDLSWNGEEFSNLKENGIGKLNYKYIFDNGKWKTQLEATNLSSQTTKAFGFDQIIDLNSDTIKFDGVTRNLDNFNGVTFDKAFLDANNGKVLDLLNGINFDFDLGYENLYSITVYDTGANKSQLVFDYRTSTPLLPNETLIIDPTFTDTVGNEGRVTSAQQTGTTCSATVGSKLTDFTQAAKDDADLNERCNIAWLEFDISGADPSWSVDSVTLEYDIIVTTLPSACMWRASTVQPSTGDAQTLYDNGLTGTPLGASDSACTTVANGKIFTFNATGISSVQDAINASQSWFGIAMLNTDQERSSVGNANVRLRQADAILSITYNTDKPTEFDVTITTATVGDTTKIDGTVTLTNGYPFPITLDSIDILRDGISVNLNNTNSTFTALGQVINFGSIWNRMLTADNFNFTALVTVDNATGSQITNSSSSITSREYNPNYLPAIDNPSTQGNVNATIERFDSGDDLLLKVNRIDVNTGDTWQIECIAQTNTQAIQVKNQTASWSGDWQNTTNTGYFNTTFSGFANSHAYVTCFNEDVLFTLTDFTDSSLALLGIQLFDESYGSMIGVPVGIFFLVMTAGMANKRTAPTFIIFITGIAGTMATIGFFSFEPLVWGLALVTAMLGIFVNQKIF
jgi:hypothetical protein